MHTKDSVLNPANQGNFDRLHIYMTAYILLVADYKVIS